MTGILLKTSCALVALVALAAGSAAFAQASPMPGAAPSGANNSAEAAAPPSAETGGQASVAPAEGGGAIQEIVVTANKRAENLQKVAGSVTAVSQASLIRQGIKDITDITKVVPEIRVQPGTLTNVGIRGIRAGSYGPTTDSPNAMHVDGVYLSRFTGLSGFFYDVQRIEVLAGPQGTLYGRNSAGGTINVISNKPTMDDVHAQGSIDYGNYSAFAVNAAVNLPLSDTLAIRAAYYHSGRTAYANNGLDDSDINSGRLSLLWKPSSRDSLLLTADRELTGGRGTAGGGMFGSTVYRVIKNPTIATNANGSIALVPSGAAGGVVVPIVTSADARDSAALLGSADGYRADNRSTGYMGQYDHDFGWATLTAQAAYRSNYAKNPSQSLSTPQDRRLLTVGILRPTAPSFQEAHANWNSQEIRLTSPSNQPLTFVVGLYRFRERTYDNHSGMYNVLYPNTGAATIGQITIVSPQTVNSDTFNAVKDNAYSAFGQAVFSPEALRGLHVTGGLRYNYEKKRGFGNTILNSVNCAGGCFDGRASFKKVTYKANIAYDITPQNMIYVDHSTGFKSGGFSYGVNARYRPENIKAYEIGTKNRFFDNKVQLNAAAWHYDYTGLLTTINLPYINPQLPPPGVATSNTTVNGGKSKYDGQSISLILQPTLADSFTFNGTHVKSRFTNFDIHTLYQLPTGPGGSLVYLQPGATDATYNYTGTPVGNAPKYNFTAIYDHIFNVFDGQLDAQALVQYVGKRLFGNQVARAAANDYAAQSLKPYATVDVSLRYAPDGGRWSITGYVRNLADKDVVLTQNYVSNANLLATSDPRVTYAYITRAYGPPRTYGLIGSFNF